MRRLTISALLCLIIAAPAIAATLKVIGPSGERQLTAEQIAALPRTTVTISDHGVAATFEGTELANVLAGVGVPSGEKLRGKELTRYVLVKENPSG
jgi:hypothetical protein